MPKISVVMPAYNTEKYISEAIESILNQTFMDFEFIIINDGSTDKTKDIIKSYSDSRIKYIENEANLGIVASLNKGLDLATGEYIARMDADDISLPNRFEKQVKYLDENQELGVIGTGIVIFGENIDQQERIFTKNSDQLKAELMFSPCFAHPTVMIRRSVLVDNNICYDMNYAGAEDYCLWIDLSDKCEFMNIPEALLKYRKHKKQITHKRNEKDISILDELVEKRFKKIGFFANYNEKKSFFMYCLGEFNCFDVELVKQFIKTLANILTINSKSNYFNQNKLKKVFSLAVIYTLNNAKINKAEKKECYKYAVSKKVFSLIMSIKVIYHSMFN